MDGIYEWDSGDNLRSVSMPLILGPQLRCKKSGGMNVKGATDRYFHAKFEPFSHTCFGGEMLLGFVFDIGRDW